MPQAMSREQIADDLGGGVPQGHASWISTDSIIVGAREPAGGRNQVDGMSGRLDRGGGTISLVALCGGIISSAALGAPST